MFTFYQISFFLLQYEYKEYLSPMIFHKLISFSLLKWLHKDSFFLLNLTIRKNYFAQSVCGFLAPHFSASVLIA